MTDKSPKTGEAIEMEPGVRRILAPNPSPMTFWGTNTYLVGTDQVAVIDPGPLDQSHFEAIKAATRGGAAVSHVVVTHSHVDHSIGAPELARQLNVPTVGFGPATKGMSSLMKRLTEEGLESGGEGVDFTFEPEIILEDGDTLSGNGWTLEAIWTPGHLSNHICLAFGDAVFTADHVMDWATSIVSPPDGDVGAFLASCEKLLKRNDRIYYPGHGDPVTNPAQRTQWLIDHRKSREHQILDLLTDKNMTPDEMVAVMYSDVPKSLHGAAKRNVFAHLIDLFEREIITVEPRLSDAATYRMK